MAKKSKLTELAIPLATALICISLFFCCIYIAFDEEEQGQGCYPMPEGFSESDLEGTWLASSLVHPQVFDTLILRVDGTYKQIIHIEHLEEPATDYETDWQPWWLEYDGTGIGYLHMQGMRVCAISNSQDCDWINDGDIPIADYCLDRWIRPMPGETILLVITYQENETPHYVLELTQGFEASSWVYVFQEP